MSERSQNARAEHEVRRLLRRSHPLSDVPDGRDDRGIYEWREHVPRRRASPVRSLRWMRRRHERSRPACTTLAYRILFSGVHTQNPIIRVWTLENGPTKLPAYGPVERPSSR